MSAVSHPKTKEEYDDVLSHNNIVIVKYGALWCAPCRAMDPVFETAALDNEDIKFVSVDVDQIEHPHTNVRTLPTFKVFINGKCNEEYTFTGADKKKFVGVVNKLTENEVSKNYQFY